MLLAALLATPTPARAGVGEGQRAVEFRTVVDEAGRNLRLAQFRGKVVVLTFGASWCVPCKKELPALEQLARAYQGKQVAFVAVNIDTDRGKGRAFMKKAGLRVVQRAFDPSGGTIELYDPPKMPTTFVIGPRGIVHLVHGGYQAGDEQKLARMIDRLLSSAAR
jgi:thiol-disulfide isomerase/thioredoxin